MTRATQPRELDISTKSLTAMFARLDEWKKAEKNIRLGWIPLMREFGLSRRDAGKVVKAWMQEN